MPRRPADSQPIPKVSRAEAIRRINESSRCVIVGFPECGKTTLARATVRHVTHLDDYKHHGWEASLDHIIAALRSHSTWVAEGVQGFRLLRRIAKSPALRLDMQPDLVVVVDGRLRAHHQSTARGLQTVWHDYLDHETSPPDMIRVEGNI